MKQVLRTYITFKQRLISKHFLLTTAIMLCMTMTGISQDTKNKHVNKNIPAPTYKYYRNLFPAYEYSGRRTPSIKKEKLETVKSVNDIAPDLWRNLAMNFNDRLDLDHRSGADYAKGYNFIETRETNYILLIDYAGVEISGICNGKLLSAKGNDDKLTQEQKTILNNADLGTDIMIKVKFKYKKGIIDNLEDVGKIIKGQLAITVVPEVEAEYPGGYKQLTNYLINNVLDKVSGTPFDEKIQWASVNFTINEEGTVTDVKIGESSSDAKTDKLIIDAIYKMPKWKPAGNSKGIKVKQQFTIPLSNGGGC